MNNSLFHWGIPGMKWGIRRRGSGSSNRSESEDHKTVKILRSKKVSEMSNDELKKLTTRLQLEKQLKDLNMTESSQGIKFINDILIKSGKQVATKFVGEVLSTTIGSIAKRSGFTSTIIDFTKSLTNKTE